MQRHRTREQEEGRKEIREPAERERAWEPAERGRAEGRASDSAPSRDRGWGLEDYEALPFQRCVKFGENLIDRKSTAGGH